MGIVSCIQTVFAMFYLGEQNFYSSVLIALIYKIDKPSQYGRDIVWKQLAFLNSLHW